MPASAPQPAPDLNERERLILEHMPQVRAVARRIHERLPQSVAIEDLVSAGVLGLIAAVDNFDPSLNVKLRTYAELKIRSAILDSLRNLDSVPRSQRRRARVIENSLSKLRQQMQRAPVEEEVAADLGVSLDEYRQWLVDIQGISLFRQYDYRDPEAGGVVEDVPDDAENLPSRLLERAEMKGLIERAILEAPKQEQLVLHLYFQRELETGEIARIMNLRVARVSQIKSQGIARIRAQIIKRLAPQRRTASCTELP